MATSTKIKTRRSSSRSEEVHESFKINTTTSSYNLQDTEDHDYSSTKGSSTGEEATQDDDYHGSLWAKVERNQIPLSRNLMILLYSLNWLSTDPRITNFTRKFLHLQNQVGYNSEGNPIYDIHIDDIYFVTNWVITVTFLRSFLMKYCFGPFAAKFCHIYSRKAKIRFAEQSWSWVYYSISFIYGVFLYLDAPYYNNLDQIYINWPNFLMDARFKSYYLISMAFWLQQIFVLHVEKPRKDHYQMFSHHIITCCLIIGSYYYYFFRIGHLILMIMDSVDICLAAAKMLKYAGRLVACDAMFVVFLVSWIGLRHGAYNYIFYHAWHKSVHLMQDGQCMVGNDQKRCWTPTVINTFLGLLGGLQIITCIWMYLISKVAYKVIIGVGAEDVRSDEDDTDFENNEEEKVQGEGVEEKEFQEIDEVEVYHDDVDGNGNGNVNGETNDKSDIITEVDNDAIRHGERYD
ncbi:lag1 [Candida theae]|uniref:Lag1 n=1 Tax=Candida theae TaxID=1198502 RepID=A0AAD5BA96_9ASCO|nr:lag1 [Candida theae]KAI5948965.1 lag1 [Candida theae]